MAEIHRKARGRPKSPFTEPGGSTIQALDRALVVLSALAKQDHASLTDLSERLNIPTATTHRILATLQQNGYAELDEASQTWAVGIEAYRTGSAYLNRTTLMDVARPVMRALMLATGETANLAVPDGAEVVFIGQVETQNPIRAFFAAGTRTPMHASGTGKAILANLPEAHLARVLARAELTGFTSQTLASETALRADLEETRRRGWSFDQEERHAGMSCIGAAIYDARGEVVAGVSISGPSTRFADRRMDMFGTRVAEAAAEITQGIGGIPA
ncbi:IclR family transcriptional regulator [Rhodophyticola sp. CCM32]|uniref:HTH-type transcriptional regulator BhcR n=1 Tax=Rhodophyticola sp. CCM32 TaxID=2916397 RepID=UPI00107F062F|nr:HTH-type transcriptional regulator BhcR [Rhodophyticola sp. CCM32]QBY01090.1 IclR family transcriptional regulator [Rhodophyticola sp. CCM32]